MSDTFSYEDAAKPAPSTKPESAEPFSYEEATGQTPSRGFKGWARDVAATAVKGAIGVPEAIVGLADIPTGGRVGKFLENEGGSVGFRPKEAKELVNDWHSDATKEAQRKFQAADGIVDKTVTAIKNPSLIATAVGESLPSMGLGGVAGRGLMAATRLGQMGAKGAALAGAAGEGITAAGSAAEQIRQETPDGLLNPTQAGLAAGTGVATAGFGVLGGRVANKLGIGDAETMLAQGQKGMAKQFADDAAAAAANPLHQQAVKGIPRRVIEGAISEGFLEELPQSMAEQIFQNLALGKDWLQDVDSAAVMGVLSGAAMGGAASGYHGIRHPATGGAMSDPGAEHGQPAPQNPGDVQAAPSTGLDRVRQAYADQLAALQEQEQGDPGVPQTTPPDGAAVLAQQQAEEAARRQAAQEASRAVASPDDEIYQSTGAEAPPSVRMGLDPAAGPLSAGAALAVDTGVHGQMQQAAALTQAAEQAAKDSKKPAAGTQKQEQQAQARQGVDPETGEIQQGAMAGWSDAQLSEAFRGAQSRDVRMQMARELSRRRAEREQQDLQAELDAEQTGTVPGAERADAAFASLIEDAGPVPADLSIPTTKGSTDGHQADQAQQARSKSPQEGATPAVARAAPDAQGIAGPQDASAAGVANGAPTTNPGTQATTATGAQAAQADAETTEQRAQRVASAGEAWTRMPTVERQALAQRADLKPIVQKNVHRTAWESLNGGIRRKLADAMGARNDGKEIRNSQMANGPLANDGDTIAADAQATTTPDVHEPPSRTPESQTLDELLKQVNDELANQGAVQNANTRAKRDKIRKAIAERDFPAILKAVDGDVGSAEAINQALQFAGDEPKAKVIERVLKNRGISEEYRQRWAERLLDGQVDELDAEMQSYEDRATASLRGKAVGDMLEMGNGTLYRIAGIDIAANRIRLVRNPDQLNERTVLVAQDDYNKLLADHEQTMAEAAAKPAAPAQDTGAALQAAMQAAGWTAEVAGADNTIWIKTANKDRYTALWTPGVVSMEVTVLVDAVDTQIASFKMSDPKAAADAANKAVADDVAQSAPAPSAGAKPAPAKKPAAKKPSADQTRAKADLMNALADLGDILGKNTRMNIVPEQEQKLLPVLTRVLDAAFRLGYHKFKDSAKFALDQIRTHLGDDAADALTLDHLQGAYIAMAGGKQGADTKRAVIYVESKADIEAHEAVTADSETDTMESPAEGAAPTGADDERNNLPSQSPQALGNVAAAEGGQPESSGRTGAGAADGGQGSRQDGGRADGAGVPAARSGGSGAGRVRAAQAGARGKSRAVGTQGTGDAGAPAPAADGRVAVPGGAASAPNIPAADFQITDEVGLGKGGEVQKFNDNLAAIRTLKQIEAENRRATPDEQAALARYVGWGGLASAFPDPISGEFKDKWKARGEELRELLTDAEYKAARRSTRNAHYTSQTIVTGIWDAVRRLGYRGGLVLESSMGSGNFLGLAPADLAHRFVGVEYDSLTSRIAQALYPQATVLHSGFQSVPVPDNAFMLNIGNPPFGSESLRFQFKPELQGVSIHNQFFRAGMDALRPGGLQAMVVSRYLMDAKDKSSRLAMASKAKLIAAIRLPDTAFKENARTDVVTDILIFQKLEPGEQAAMEVAVEEYRKLQAKAKGADAQAAALVPAWVETVEMNDPLGGEPMTVNAHFQQNPNHVLGVLERSGSMQHGADITVRLDNPAELGARLAAVVATLPENVQNIEQEVMDATAARHRTMSDALRIAMAAEETGHVKTTPDGKLQRVIERETPEGDYEFAYQDIDENSPWSESLSQDAEGRWYELVEARDEQGQKVKVLGKDGKPTKRNLYERKVFADVSEISPRKLLGKTGLQRLAGLVKLRDLLKRQLTLETADAAKVVMEGNRKALAAAYAEFIKANGPVNRSANMALAMTMPDGGLVAALEVGYQPERTAAQAASSGLPEQNEVAKPAPILRERVVPKYEPATKASTASDALAITLSERGRVDMERIASLLGVSEEAAAEQLQAGADPLVFKDPESGAWETADVYLSGMVKRKLNAARAAGLAKNVQALEKVIPEDWTAENVQATMGATWVPPDVYAAFMEHLAGGKTKVSFSSLTNSFSLSTGNTDPSKFKLWSSEGAPVDYIVTRILNSKPVTVTGKDANGNTYVDKELTALAGLKAREIVAEFGDWVFKDGDRRQRLVELFNEKFNTRVVRQYNGQHLALPGKVPDSIIKMRRHQLNAIWRGIYERFMLVDHAVGAGKTFTAIARAMERRRMGLSRKPMIVVPNHLVEQWEADVYRLYPGAKVLAAGKNDFEAKRRRRLFGKIATGDWDIVIVPHSSFGFIGISQETESRYLELEMAQAQAAIQEAWDQAKEDGTDNGRRKPFGVKEAERLAEKIQARMDRLKEGVRDRLLTFEQMGVDDLTVDEAHEFKNLYYSSNLTGVRGMGDKTGSRKANDLYNKVRVLTEQPTATVSFLTGTPISNSAVEMFTMLRYLAAGSLEEMGLTHFDAFRTQFVEATPAFEPTESGRLKQVTRLGRTWSNMRSLMDLYYQVTDAVSLEDIKRFYAEDNQGQSFPVPKVAGDKDRRLIAIKPTPAQEQELKDVMAGFDGLEDIEDPYERNAERLRLMDRARKVSLDVRAVNPRNPSTEEGGKLQRVAQEVKRIYDKWHDDKGTQLVFLDRSVPRSKGDDAIIKGYDALVAKRDAALAEDNQDAYQEAQEALDRFDPNEIAELRQAQASPWSAYQQIKDNLVAMGIPADEIRFVQEASNDEQKAALFDAVNGGKVRVLLGSTPRMGAGTNVQKRAVALHHVDVTWKPSDIEQREGRVVRQGNELLAKHGDGFEVEILAYATERTVDAKMWDLNATKLRTINGIRKYQGDFTMEFDDEEAVGMAEMAALASGNPLLLERVQAESEIQTLEMLERAHRRKMWGVADELDRARRAIERNPGMIETARQRTEDVRKRIGAVDEAAQKRAVTVEGERFADQPEALRAAEAAIKLQQEGNDKARFAITIDGERVSSKDAVSAAIGAALGDVDTFETTVNGKRVLQRTAAAREIAALANEQHHDKDGAKMVPLGSLYGYELVADIDFATVKGDRVKNLRLSLMDGEKTIASDDANEVPSQIQYTATNIRAPLERLVDRVRAMASSTDSDYLTRQLERAKRDLPDLEARAGETFPKAGELVAKRERLKELVQLLDGKAAAQPSPEQESDAGDEENFGAAQAMSAGSAADRAIMDMVREGRAAPDILRLVAGTSKSRFNRQVARMLLKTGAAPSVELVQADLGSSDGFKFLAKYSRKNDKLTMTPGAEPQAEHIFMHEMVHAATLRALDRKGLASLQMRRLYEHVKRQGDATGHYGMKNVGEFVAEAFTNPEFQRELRGISAPPGGTLKSAWDGFVRILRSILGLPQDAHDALSRALELGVAVMREDMALRQRGAQQRQAGDAFVQSPQTRATYEGRIDALFNGGKAHVGTAVLDRSDVMGLLGHPNVPLMLNERHLLDGLTNHPEMTAAAWKKVPGWLENPAAVFTDPNHPGRLTVIAPERIAGYPVLMAVEPNPTPTERGKTAPFQLLVTVFAKTAGDLPALGYLGASGRLLYADTKKAPEVWQRAGVNPQAGRHPGPRARDIPRTGGPTSGAKKILTEKHLGGYRRANTPVAFMGQPTPPADSNADSAMPAKPLTLDRVNQLVQEALSGIRGAPPVETVGSPADIGLVVPPATVPYGITLRSGDVYVFQSAMGSDLDVFRTVFHELFHRGVRVLVPKDQYVQVMLDLAKGDSRIQQYAIRWKDSDMAIAQKENLRKMGYTGAELTAQFEALAIEEALADVAEEIKAEGKLGSRPKNHIIRFLANWLAKVADLAGMKKLAAGIRAMTYNEAERFVMGAIDRSGEPAPRAGVNNMSAKDGARTQGVVDSKVVDDDVAHFGMADAGALKSGAIDHLHRALSHPGKVSLWDKTVGTMRNLAERNPAFKPVYQAAQRFIDDVSMLGNDAADRAPRLLPRVETLADLKKKPITAADNKAVGKPLFEGTLLWARDLDGTPVTTEALNAKYRNATADEKAQILLRTGKIQAQMLKVWRGLPVGQFNAIINNKFDSTILKPGVVWTAKELGDLFGLNDQQVSLYQEARRAIDRSIDMTARADMLRMMGDEYASMREVVLEQASMQDAMALLTDTLQSEARENPDQADRLMGMNNSVVKSYERAAALQEAGYAPLSRFGRYTVDVVSPDGTREYFGMFESMPDSNKMKASMEKEFPGATVTQGTMSDEAYKLFQGITPESLEQFGGMLGLKSDGATAQDKAFQAYLQLAKNNHSALKRLIHRKGIAGYSEDVGRVLASFVYSNARLAAGGLNAGTLETAIENIPKEQGELRDVAMGLRSYIQDPQEEGQAVRGMLFAQYLGGSVASAMVNMTQPFQITMPWLSQYGGMRKAAGQMARALKDMGTKGFKYEPDLEKALQDAVDDGTVSPQEIHQLMAQARGTGSLRAGDGTRMGDARAAMANNWERTKVAWGQPFALAEQFNRRSTFIAAYRTAKEQGMPAPAEFARRAVQETQFVYSKANKMRWGRGAIGGTMMTFKTYSVSYLELMHRMWTQGGPEGKRAVGWAVAMLMLMGGAGGLPFMEDAEDLIDGAGQLMGYNISTKQWRKQLLRDTIGKELGDFVEQGVSGLPGAPIDVSGRLGMGNLLPGTGLLLTKQNRERDLLEIAGPAGDLIARGFTGARKMLTGDLAGAALEVSPTAVRNAVKGLDMATSGIYKDTKGYKVIDTTLDEAIAKAIGFQPRSVAEVHESNSFMQRSKSFYIQTSSDIKAQWAQALFNKDEAALEQVRERLADWNRDNPDQPIVVKMPDVWKRVREMGKDRTQRIADTAPKALRGQMREMARENG